MALQRPVIEHVDRSTNEAKPNSQTNWLAGIAATIGIVTLTAWAMKNWADESLKESGYAQKIAQQKRANDITPRSDSFTADAKLDKVRELVTGR